MPSATIQVKRRLVTDRCIHGAPVRADQSFLEFEITVDQDGCYAIDVELFDHDSTALSAVAGGYRADGPSESCSVARARACPHQTASSGRGLRRT